MSAGALLSRTHEELVLLLIQLRRQSTAKSRAIDVRYKEINNLENQLQNCSDPKLRRDCLNRLDKLTQNVNKLERQLEKNKPLINLVDNMVKLGALYRTGNTPLRNHMNLSMSNMANVVDANRSEFSHRVQERKLLQDDRRLWNQLNPNQAELQVSSIKKEMFVFNILMFGIFHCRVKFKNCTNWINCCKKSRKPCTYYSVTKKILKERWMS